jgi:hypothetical protein
VWHLEKTTMNSRFAKPLLGLVVLALLTPINLPTAYAQTAIWFGSYTDGDGKTCQGRYVVEEETGRIVAVQLAPYGMPPIDFRVIQHDTNRGLLVMEWPGNPEKKCTAIRYHPFYYAGNWIEGMKVEPIVIKKFDRQDAERQGNFFKPSHVDVSIIEHAMGLLSSEDRWNRSDDRTCGDSQSVSLFCALYKASRAVDGEYRHLRPAMKIVREIIEEEHPDKYEHVLQDFNNASDTSFEDVLEVLRAAKRRLLEVIEEK